MTGLPKIIQISSSEVTEALQEPLQAVVSTVRATLEKTPPELAADIIDRGGAHRRQCSVTQHRPASYPGDGSSRLRS